MGNKKKGSRGVNIARGANALDRIQLMEQAMYEKRMSIETDFLLQIGCDAFIMSCADLFDLQPSRAVEAFNTYRGYINNLLSHLLADADDPDLVYFWTDLDRRMLQIVGKDAFAPREKRYDETGERVFKELFEIYAAKLYAKKVEAAKVKEKDGAEDGR